MTDIDLSVFKRRDEPLDAVHARLKSQGFEHTGTALNGRIHYHENQEGIALTLVDGPAGTLVFPSGPLRGAFFGDRAVGLGLDRGPASQSSSSSSNQSSRRSQRDRGSSKGTQFNV